MNQEEKKKRGQFGNVLLTDQEVESLEVRFGVEVTEEAINFLDKYIKENNHKVNNHKLAIHKWVVDVVKEEIARRPQRKMVTEIIELLREKNLAIREALNVLENAKSELYELAYSKQI